MTSRPVLLPLLLALLMVGCGRSEVDPGPEEDTGRARDGGTRDAGRPDSGVPDGGNRDGGTADGGTADGGTPDAGTPDGGSRDGGTPDGGCVEGWRRTSDLPWSSTSPRAVPLPDGRILVAGGGINAENAALYDPAIGGFTRIGPMHSPRGGFKAAALLDGRVLLAGGTGGVPYPHPELYDPATGQFTLTDRLPSVRYNHDMVRLADGRVLLAGGHDGSVTTATATLWNPSTGLWTLTDPLPAPRENLTLTLLPDGTVLAAGGFARPRSDALVPAADAWRYDPATGRWSTTGSLHQARGRHQAVRLASGEVLMVGGYWNMSDAPDPVTSRAELYDWRTGAFTEVSPMRFPRVGHLAELLPSGEVLVAAGAISNRRDVPNASEIYSPATNTWRLVPRMLFARYSPASAVLPDGSVLAVAGSDLPTAATTTSVEIFTSCPAP